MRRGVVEGEVGGAAAALLRRPVARVVDEDLAHGPAGDAQEVDVAGVGAAGRHTEVRLVDDGRRVERQVAAPPGAVPVREVAEVVVEPARELVRVVDAGLGGVLAQRGGEVVGGGVERGNVHRGAGRVVRREPWGQPTAPARFFSKAMTDRSRGRCLAR